MCIGPGQIDEGGTGRRAYPNALEAALGLAVCNVGVVWHGISIVRAQHAVVAKLGLCLLRAPRATCPEGAAARLRYLFALVVATCLAYLGPITGRDAPKYGELVALHIDLEQIYNANPKVIQSK